MPPFWVFNYASRVQQALFWAFSGIFRLPSCFRSLVSFACVQTVMVLQNHAWCTYLKGGHVWSWVADCFLRPHILALRSACQEDCSCPSRIKSVIIRNFRFESLNMWRTLQYQKLTSAAFSRLKHRKGVDYTNKLVRRSEFEYVLIMPPNISILWP